MARLSSDELLSRVQDMLFERNIYRAALQKIAGKLIREDGIAEYAQSTLDRQRRGRSRPIVS